METDVARRPAPVSGGKTLSIVRWILLGATLALSFTSFLSFGIWIVPWPVAVATLITGIIVLKRCGKQQGTSLIVALPTLTASPTPTPSPEE